MVPEADMRDAGAGLVPASTGWFVMNARDARWFHRPGRGDSLPLTGCDEFEAETFFPMLGMSIQVLPPGEPNGTYHWETEQEDFLVLAGEALLIVEGQERPLRQWDFVHCPPETRHVFVGVGDAPCVILARHRGSSRRTGRGASTAPMRPLVATTRAPPRTRRTAKSHTGGSRQRSRRAIAPACYRNKCPDAGSESG
jgi:uncharacterized cupin superfamily protein